jgi:hypothetical protein
VKSVAEEREETGLAARVRSKAASRATGPQDQDAGARRRREGYEWLFGEDDTDTALPLTGPSAPAGRP